MSAFNMNNNVLIHNAMFKCPVGQRTEHCPFKRKDILSIKNKIKWYQNLENEDREFLVDYHETCVRSRNFQELNIKHDTIVLPDLTSCKNLNKKIV